MVPFPPFLSALSVALLTVTREAENKRRERKEGEIEGRRGDGGGEKRGLKRGG